jgi:lipopolysaccharide assembly protein A
MRWVHMAIVILFVAATLIFLVQNREIVSMDFLGFSVRAPLAVIAASFYLLGAVTGGSVYALLRRSVQAAGATAAPPARSA